MKGVRARELAMTAAEVADKFSRKDRGGNPGGESFEVLDIRVLGEVTAAVTFVKSTGKRAVAFFYYVPSHMYPRWEYFFVSYAHLASLEKVKDLLFAIEQHNYEVSLKDQGLSRESPTE